MVQGSVSVGQDFPWGVLFRGMSECSAVFSTWIVSFAKTLTLKHWLLKCFKLFYETFTWPGNLEYCSPRLIWLTKILVPLILSSFLSIRESSRFSCRTLYTIRFMWNFMSIFRLWSQVTKSQFLKTYPLGAKWKNQNGCAVFEQVCRVAATVQWVKGACLAPLEALLSLSLLLLFPAFILVLPSPCIDCSWLPGGHWGRSPLHRLAQVTRAGWVDFGPGFQPLMLMHTQLDLLDGFQRVGSRGAAGDGGRMETWARGAFWSKGQLLIGRIAEVQTLIKTN